MRTISSFFLCCLFAIVIAGDYLNPEKVKKLHTLSDTITVTCYNNGIWDVCPDPADKETSESIHQQYESGWYISLRTYRISSEEYGDPTNWNNRDS